MAVAFSQYRQRKPPTAVEKAASSVAESEIDQFHFLKTDFQQIARKLNAAVTAHTLPPTEQLRWQRSADIARYFSEHFTDINNDSFLSRGELSNRYEAVWFLALAVSLIDGQVAAELGFKPALFSDQQLAFGPETVVVAFLSPEVALAVASTFWVARQFASDWNKLTHGGPWTYVDLLNDRKNQGLNNFEESVWQSQLLRDLEAKTAVFRRTHQNVLQQLETLSLRLRVRPLHRDDDDANDPLEELSEKQLCYLYRWLLYLLLNRAARPDFIGDDQHRYRPNDDDILKLLKTVQTLMDEKGMDQQDCIANDNPNEIPSVPFCEKVNLPKNPFDLSAEELFNRVMSLLKHSRGQKYFRGFQLLKALGFLLANRLQALSIDQLGMLHNLFHDLWFDQITLFSLEPELRSLYQSLNRAILSRQNEFPPAVRQQMQTLRPDDPDRERIITDLISHHYTDRVSSYRPIYPLPPE